MPFIFLFDNVAAAAQPGRGIAKALRAGASTLALGGAFLIGAPAALAHVTLQTAQAQVGSGYKAVFQVPHGCKGSATIKLSVQIPPGVIAVKPQPKPGWKVETTTGKYDQSYDFFHGAKLEEGVKTVTWSEGSLSDGHYDEFVFSSYLAPSLKPGDKLFFPTVQSCEQGVERWIEIPAAGKSARDYGNPAPALELLAPGKRHE